VKKCQKGAKMRKLHEASVGGPKRGHFRKKREKGPKMAIFGQKRPKIGQKRPKKGVKKGQKRRKKGPKKALFWDFHPNLI